MKTLYREYYHSKQRQFHLTALVRFKDIIFLVKHGKLKSVVRSTMPKSVPFILDPSMKLY